MIRRAAYWLAWALFALAYRLANLARDGVGEADEYKVGGTSSDD